MRHGMLTVVGKVDGRRIHIARCDCGNTKQSNHPPALPGDGYYLKVPVAQSQRRCA